MQWKARRRMLYTVALARGGRDSDGGTSREVAHPPADPRESSGSDDARPRTAAGLAVDGLEHQLMLALLRRGELSTMGTIDELAQVVGRRYSHASVMVALAWLEEAGLLVSRLDESRANEGLQAHLFFGVTPRGREALHEARQSYLALWDGVEPDAHEG